MLEGAVAGLSQGEPSLTVPDALYQRIDDLWAEPGGTETLARLSLLTGHPEAETRALNLLEGGSLDVTVHRELEEEMLIGRGEQVYLTHCAPCHQVDRSEEHTSELQSRGHLVCRLLLEKNNTGVLQ